MPAPHDALATRHTGGPLEGVTVLDLATVGPAARATRILCDYGAEVVKVGPVPGRGAAPLDPPFFAYSGGRGYRRLCLDLKDEDGRDAFLRLVARADVVVESFRPGVLARLQLGYDQLAAVNPRLVLCSTTGYGQEGPRSSWAGHDLDYLAVGGYLGACEPRADGGPPVPGATIADAAAGGMQAALAVLAALYGRGPGGRGVHLDVSVADGVLWLMSLAVDEHLATGAPVGHGHDVISGRYACYDCYRAADGRWLAVAAIEPRFFANLCRRLGCERWAAHQFDEEVQDHLRADFRAAFVTRERDAWIEEMAGADTCVAPVLAPEEVGDDPAFAARAAFVEATTPLAGDGGDGDGGDGDGGEVGPGVFRQVGPVLAGMPRRGAPVDLPSRRRTDTDELLRAAGLSAARVAELRKKGAAA